MRASTTALAVPTPALRKSIGATAFDDIQSHSRSWAAAGNYEKSVALNQRALEMDRRIFGPRHPRVSDTLISPGAVQYQRGKPDESEKYARQGAQIIEAWYGPEHYRTASALTLLARAIVNQQRFDEGAELLRRSLAIQERVHGPRHRMVASALNGLGIVALGRGNLDEAEACFRRMADIHREI